MSGKTLKSESTAKYFVYGLNVSSSIPCPELSPGTGTPDVTVRYGVVPKSLSDNKDNGSYYEAKQNQLLLSIDSVARYLISFGNEILVERAPGAGDTEVRLFLLGSAMGALLHQRGFLPLHGSAFEANNGCIAVLGDSGLGKSTVAGAFFKRGHRLVADDICVVSFQGQNVPIVFPGYPQLKLWADAAKRLGEDLETLPRVYPSEEKYGLHLEEGFSHNPLPLQRIFVLETSAGRDVSLKRLKGIEKIMAIINNTYRAQFLDGLNRKKSHFKQCVAVAKHVPVIRVNRPNDPLALDDLMKILEEDFSKENNCGQKEFDQS
ncbi:MAG: hypothetical protein JRI74_09320 [Deltaproteobacteria bacterium]|nr:hypothetical protein [Deltaproteobacteria bacterium]